MADRWLAQSDVRVYGFRRWHLSKARNIRHLLDHPSLTIHDCDITDPISVHTAIEAIRPSVIFHFAAESFVSPSWQHPTHYMNVNYNGTVNILDAVRRYCPETRVLIAGSGEEFGEIHEHEVPITDLSPLRPVNPYAVSKVAQDLIGFVYYKSYGVPVIRTRAFNHEGPRRDRVFGIASYAWQIARIEAGKQEPIVQVGHLDDRRNFTHVRDIIEAYCLAAEQCTPGELYLVGSEAPEQIHTFREALDQLRAMSTVSNIDVTTNPEFVRPTAVPRLIADTQRFRDLTGWEPKIGFSEMLQDILNYWREFVNADMY